MDDSIINEEFKKSLKKINELNDSDKPDSSKVKKVRNELVKKSTSLSLKGASNSQNEDSCQSN